MRVNASLVGLIVSILLGPVLLFGAKFGLGASLLDGIGGSYSNNALQESVASVGMLAVLAGMIVAPILGVRLLRKRITTSLVVLIGIGCFAAPLVLYFIVFGLPA